jgi:hypothetical protein
MRLRPLIPALFVIAILVLGLGAVAAANSVSTRPPPSSVSSNRPGLNSTPAPHESRSDDRPSLPSTAGPTDAVAAHDLGDDKGGSRSTGLGAPLAATPSTRPADDPATHDVGDDHGVHNPGNP